MLRSELPQNSKSIVAITGSTGLIGSKLIDFLTLQGFTVLLPRRQCLLTDILETKPTHIINCIGAGMDIRKNQTSEEIWEANYTTPLKLIQIAEALDAKFINIGSILEKVHPFSSPYIESKRSLTLKISSLSCRQLSAISILCPIVFALDKEHILISEILKSARSKVPVNLESPEAIREFVHFEDLARFISKLIHVDKFDHSSCEIGNGVGYRLSGLCESVLNGLVSTPWISTLTNERTNKYAVVADTDYSVNQLGFQVDFELEKWLKAQILRGSLEGE